MHVSAAAEAEAESGDIIDFLVEQKLDIEARDENGYTPLFHAVRAGNTCAARALINHNADVNAVSNWGSRPLHQAGFNSFDVSAVVELLVAHKADVNATDGEGKTPLALCVGSRGTFHALLFKCCANPFLFHPFRGEVLWSEASGALIRGRSRVWTLV